MPHMNPEARRAQKNKDAKRYYAANAERIRERQREYQRRRSETHPEQRHTISLKHHHGITHADYISMLAAQGGACGICLAVIPGAGLRWFVVDHDHTTGIVRGLLCRPCNLTIGHAKENVARLRYCVSYLERAAAKIGAVS